VGRIIVYSLAIEARDGHQRNVDISSLAEAD
jgi:hypothetical protein